MLVIYIQLCRCDISLWKCNVSRQEASRHVLSTSLCFSCSPSLSLPLISSTNLSHKTLSLPAFHPNPFRHQPVQLCFNMTASTHTHTTSQRQIWAISHVFTQQHSHVGCLNLFWGFYDYATQTSHCWLIVEALVQRATKPPTLIMITDICWCAPTTCGE